MKQDRSGAGRVTAFANGLIRVLIVLNIVCAVAFALAVLTSLPFAHRIEALIDAKYHGRVDAGAALLAMRCMGLLGVVVAVPAARLFGALRAMLATVRTGDPFVASNARHLATIGWALLAIQLLDIVFGLVILWTRHLGADTATWSPSVGGWLSVLVAFVLARVFAVGSAMREEIEGIV